MTKFTFNPRVVYSGDTCYVTIAAFIVISQSIYLGVVHHFHHLHERAESTLFSTHPRKCTLNTNANVSNNNWIHRIQMKMH